MVSAVWRVVDEAADGAQVVNVDVLVEVAVILAERARASAVEANRRGDINGACAILKTAATALYLGLATSDAVRCRRWLRIWSRNWR